MFLQASVYPQWGCLLLGGGAFSGGGVCACSWGVPGPRGGGIPACTEADPPRRQTPPERWLLLRTVRILLNAFLFPFDFYFPSEVDFYSYSDRPTIGTIGEYKGGAREARTPAQFRSCSCSLGKKTQLPDNRLAHPRGGVGALSGKFWRCYWIRHFENVIVTAQCIFNQQCNLPSL